MGWGSNLSDAICDYVVLFRFDMHLDDIRVIDTINGYVDWARQNSIPHSILLTGDPYRDLYPFGIGFKHSEHAALFRLRFDI